MANSIGSQTRNVPAPVVGENSDTVSGRLSQTQAAQAETMDILTRIIDNLEGNPPHNEMTGAAPSVWGILPQAVDTMATAEIMLDRVKRIATTLGVPL